MDMHKKRELRAKKKQEIENKESCTSVNINWDVRIYVPMLFSTVFTRSCVK